MRRKAVFLALILLSCPSIIGTVNAENKETYLDVFTPEKPDLESWSNGWAGEPDEVSAKLSEGEAVITGIRDDQNFGSIHKTVTVDFEKYSYLEIEVTRATERWYIIFSSLEIENGFIRIQGDTKRTGKIRYNLWNYPQLAGEMSFDIQIGVSAPKKQSQKDVQMAFKGLRFIDTGARRPFKGPKLVDNKPVLAIPTDKVQITPPVISKIASASASNEDKKDLIPVVKKTIFEIFAKEVSPTEIRSSAPEFDDTNKDAIVLENASYKVSFSKKNGAILAVEDKINKELISSGSVGARSWRLDFYKAKSLSSRDFSPDSGEKTFDYKWQKSKGELLFTYQDKKSDFKLKTKISPSKENYIDFQTEIENGYEAPIILVNFPEALSFKLEKLKRFIFPYRGGLAFKPGFFSQRRFISESQYLFSDYIAVEAGSGDLSLYTIQEPGRWTEQTMSIGYDSYQNGVGFYTYALASYIEKPKKSSLSTWEGPMIRMRVGETTQESVQHYVKDNALDKIANLDKRMERGLFEKLSKSVVLKFDFAWINQKFKDVSEIIKTLPSPTVIHLVAFWEKGFDQNYPDYLPPNKAYGTLEDLKDLVAVAHGEGDLVMPYTNPTWWNESKTVETLGKKNIAVIKLNGDINEESYWGKNWGIITSPTNPEVVKRTQQTVREFKYDIPSDILFEDQLGARPWQYDLNPKARGRALYKQGLIDFAKRDSKQIPVMCEGGFDGLMPYVIAFSDMSVSNALPPDKTFNTWYGENNWEVFPYALYVAHQKNAFYQHNLAHEVFTNSKDQLTWNMAYGHNLNQGYWPDAWKKDQKKWFYIDDAFQKAVASRCFGKKLTDFQNFGDGIIFSRFEDIAVVANLSKTKPYRAENFLIPANGFLAKSKDESMVAGIFNVFNGDLLAGEHFIIVEKEGDKIIVRQPDPKITLISVNRPAAWKKPGSIKASCDGQAVPVAVTEDKITFLYDRDDIDSEYELSYLPAKEDIELTVRPEKNYVKRGDLLKVNLNAKNLNGAPVTEGKLALSVWLVHSDGPVPGAWAGYLGDKTSAVQTSDVFYSLPAGSEVSADFTVPVPEKTAEGDMIWLKGEVIYDQDLVRKVKQIQTKANIISQPINIEIEPNEVIIYPGLKKQIEIKIKNNQIEPLNGAIKVETDLPKGALDKDNIAFSLDAMEEKSISLNLLAMASAVGKDYQLVAKAGIDNITYSSGICSIKTKEAAPEISLGPQNALILGKKQSLCVGVRAHKEMPLNGWLTIEIPEGWQIAPQKRLLELSAGEYKKFDFVITPTSKVDTDITAVVSAAGGAVTKLKEPFKVISENKEAVLIESDIDQDGYTDFVLANGLVEVRATEAAGGRILSFYVKETGDNQLYSVYATPPENPQKDQWVEYGGINDWFPKGWPGDVWVDIWKYEAGETGPVRVSVRMWTETPEKLYLERTMTLNADSPVLEVKYRVKNNSESEQEFVWANHPDLACGPSGAAEDNQIVIPTKDKGILIRDYSKSMSKNEYAPGENWVLGYDKPSNEYFMQQFDKSLVDKIGVWEGIGFYTMELTFKPRKLKPQEEFDFEVKYRAGKEDLQSLIKR